MGEKKGWALHMEEVRTKEGEATSCGGRGRGVAGTWRATVPPDGGGNVAGGGAGVAEGQERWRGEERWSAGEVEEQVRWKVKESERCQCKRGGGPGPRQEEGNKA